MPSRTARSWSESGAGPRAGPTRPAPTASSSASGGTKSARRRRCPSACRALHGRAVVQLCGPRRSGPARQPPLQLEQRRASGPEMRSQPSHYKQPSKNTPHMRQGQAHGRGVAYRFAFRWVISGTSPLSGPPPVPLCEGIPGPGIEAASSYKKTVTASPGDGHPEANFCPNLTAADKHGQRARGRPFRGLGTRGETVIQILPWPPREGGRAAAGAFGGWTPEGKLCKSCPAART